MSHMVESLAYVSNEENGRYRPWHGLGTSVDHAMTSQEALEISGLNWNVSAHPVFANGIEVPNWKCNMRDTDNKVLGMVHDRYQIVQNKEAFDFTDALIGEGVTYETAGSLDGGKRIFLLGKLPEIKILGDEVVPYCCFTNGFDGFYSIKACCTPVRVVCNNTLNFAFSSAKRVWQTRHIGNLQSKLDEAKRTLELVHTYNEEFAKYAERAANTRITEEEAKNVIEKLFPVDENSSDRQKASVEDTRKAFENCMYVVDLSKFYGTVWGLMNAASDFAYHSNPKRATAKLAENRMNQALDGCKLLDKVMELCPISMD